MSTPTPTDRAEAHRTEMLRRLSTALTGVEKYANHDEREARHTAAACRLLLIGALTASEITSTQAWTYVRGHIRECLEATTLTEDTREVYQAVLSLLDGK